jgi:CheY-like chemotaxis protein
MAVVLVVDDNESIRSFVSTLLESAGHQIVTAANGAEAVAVYRTSRSPIDLVVTDLNMPTMDGVQEILRIRVTNPNAKFICMTGASADRCPAGIALVNKPFSVPEFLSCVEDVLKASADRANTH